MTRMKECIETQQQRALPVPPETLTAIRSPVLSPGD